MFTLRRWGLWKTFTSPEKYCDPTYVVDGAMRQMFDHLAPPLSHLDRSGRAAGEAGDEDRDEREGADKHRCIQLHVIQHPRSSYATTPLRWPANHLTWGIDVPQLPKEGYVDPSARTMVAGYQTELRNQIEKVPRHRSIGALNSVLRCIPNLSVIDAN